MKLCRRPLPPCIDLWPAGQPQPTVRLCAQQGLAIMKDKTRQVGNGEAYMTPDQNGALQDVITAYWNRDMPVEKVQKDIIAALRD